MGEAIQGIVPSSSRLGNLDVRQQLRCCKSDIRQARLWNLVQSAPARRFGLGVGWQAALSDAQSFPMEVFAHGRSGSAHAGEI